jgi:hypothetical protein
MSVQPGANLSINLRRLRRQTTLEVGRPRLACDGALRRLLTRRSSSVGSRRAGGLQHLWLDAVEPSSAQVLQSI